MRTTLTLEDDAASVARHFAEKHNVTLGMAVSILIRRAHEASARNVKRPDWYTPLSGPPDGPIVTIDFVNELLDETW